MSRERWSLHLQHLEQHILSQASDSPLNTTGLFPKPKPVYACGPKASGECVKVLHMSDFYLDPKYKVSSEANCSSRLCCRSNNVPKTSQITFPAPAYNTLKCDTPYNLGLAASAAVGLLTSTDKAKESLGCRVPQWAHFLKMMNLKWSRKLGSQPGTCYHLF